MVGASVLLLVLLTLSVYKIRLHKRAEIQQAGSQTVKPVAQTQFVPHVRMASSLMVLMVVHHAARLVLFAVAQLTVSLVKLAPFIFLMKTMLVYVFLKLVARMQITNLKTVVIAEGVEQTVMFVPQKQSAQLA